MISKTSGALVLALASSAALAAPVTYDIDPDHTYPSFEADHMGGLSVWRGKINKSAGTIVLDREAGTGTVEVVMDMTTFDTGHDKMDEHSKSGDILDVANYPSATYKGKLVDFMDGAPTRVEGELTFHGVTKPVELTINTFKCMEHPMKKIEVCGADAVGHFNRDDFGVDYGKPMFDMGVKILVTVEAFKQQ